MSIVRMLGFSCKNRVLIEEIENDIRSVKTMYAELNELLNSINIDESPDDLEITESCRANKMYVKCKILMLRENIHEKMKKLEECRKKNPKIAKKIREIYKTDI